MRKVGIVLILVGFFIPLILFFFSSNYSPKDELLDNIMGKGRYGILELHLWTTSHLKVVTIPYRYVFISGIVLIFLGTGIITLRREP